MKTRTIFTYSTMIVILFASASIFLPLSASPRKSELDSRGLRNPTIFALGQVQQDWIALYNCDDDPNSYDCGSWRQASTTDMEIDSKGNIYVTGLSTSTDTCSPYYTTIKYDSEGIFKWSAVIDPYGTCGHDPLNGEEPRATMLSTFPALTLYESEIPDQSALYVVGEQEIYEGSYIPYFVVVKYDIDTGAKIWKKHYLQDQDIPGNFWQGWAEAVTVDSEGYIYVTGTVDVSPYECYSERICTLKLEPTNGDIVWCHLSDDKFAYGLLLDVLSLNGQPPVLLVSPDDQYVYLAGTVIAYDENCNSVSDSEDFYMAKYSAGDGSLIWESLYDRIYGDDHGWDIATDLAIDSQYNAVVTGSSTYGYKHHYVTVKFDNETGGVLWEQPPQGYNDGYYGYIWPSSRAIAIDQDDNIYVTGSMNSDDHYYGVYGTLKLDSDGIIKWTAYYDGPASDDGANAIAIDQAGNIYVTGESQGTYSYDTDCATVKYNSEGEEQWAVRYNRGEGSTADRGRDIRVDQSGNVYVSGRSGPNDYGDKDYLLLKYSQYNSCIGDIDGDGDTDHSDLGELLSAWGSHPGDPNWNPDADLDDSGDVGHSDLGILLGDWGCGCSA